MILPSNVLSFGGETHKRIALEALTLFNTDELLNNRPTIMSWAYNEDYYNYTNLGCVTEPPTPPGVWVWCREPGVASRDHFWDADTGELLLPGVTPANEKAEDYWNRAITAYRGGEKDKAYEFLGAVVHLLSDMGSPAHIHNDNHALCKPEFGITQECDHIEEFLESNYYKWFVGTGSSIPNYTLHGLMYFLNQQASWFPSNDVQGNDVDENGTHHPEWHIGWPTYSSNDLTNDETLEKISSILKPLTTRYGLGFINYFGNNFNLLLLLLILFKF